MKTNVLKAIINIIVNKIDNIAKYNELTYKTRVNNLGSDFEKMIQNSFCNSYNLSDAEKVKIESEYFSYLANQNNPPDLIIRNGDAVEIKKIETKDGTIALNSSFPKDKLYSNSTMITESCRKCEDRWVEKDICYIIGSIDKNKSIQSLWFVYGDCYCAKPEIYTRIKNKITDGINQLGIELTNTNEIAKVKKVDPLGITDLRVRGMWSIEHPNKIFNYVFDKQEKSHIRAIMLQEKYYSFEENDRINIENIAKVIKVKIKDPNNPANLLDAVLIEFIFE